MSLINDALKRASQSDRNRPSSAAAPARLQPVAARRSSVLPWVVGLMVVVVLALAGWFFSQWWNASRPSSVAAIAPTPKVEPVMVLPPAPAPAPPVARLEPGPAVIQPAPAAAPVPSAPVEPKWPVALTLKGIFFSKSNPHALINGRTVGPGDTIGGVLVAKIESDRVRVEWNGQTKELVMEAP
jgi:hypothetical protein